MDEKPVIKLKLTQTDKILEVISSIALIAFWLMAILSYSKLPDLIPIHYNGLGEVDNYAGKKSIFLLPIIGTLIFLILTFVVKYPETLNYPTKITVENAERQYANSTRRIRFLKLLIILVFLLIDFKTIQTALGISEGLGIWFLPLILGLIFIPMGYYSYKSYKLK